MITRITCTCLGSAERRASIIRSSRSCLSTCCGPGLALGAGNGAANEMGNHVCSHRVHALGRHEISKTGKLQSEDGARLRSRIFSIAGSKVQTGSGMRSTKQEGREEEESGGEVHLYTGVWPS